MTALPLRDVMQQKTCFSSGDKAFQEESWRMFQMFPPRQLHTKLER